MLVRVHYRTAKETKANVFQVQLTIRRQAYNLNPISQSSEMYAQVYGKRNNTGAIISLCCN